MLYKYYFDKGHTFDEMSNWTYEEKTLALGFLLYDLKG